MGVMGNLSITKDKLNDELIGVSITYGDLIFNAVDNEMLETADLHSRSLIVLIADFIERYRQELSIETNRRYTLEKSNLSSWALSVKFASNWVRHHSEWFEKYYFNFREQIRENLDLNGDSYVSTNIDNYGFKSYELHNIKKVMELAEVTDVDELFVYGNGSAYKVVRKLRLDKFDEASEYFLEFIHEVI